MTKKLILLPFILLSQNLFANGNTGGMDGGGGGTLPANPASIFQVQTIALEAKAELLFLINSYEFYGDMRPADLNAKLFGGSRRIQDVLKELRLEVRLDQPCYTSTGKEVDASIYATKSNTICLSASRIAPKIDTAAAKREVIALLAHEISHFMGATEEEATGFQKDIARFIQNSSEMPNYLNPQIKMQVTQELGLMASGFRSAVEALKQNNFKVAAETLFGIQTRQFRLNEFLRPGHASYAMFSPQESDYQDLLETQLVWATKFSRVLNDGQGSPAQADYEAAFKGRDFFLFGEKSYNRDNVYNSQKIYKIHSAAELMTYLLALGKEYDIRATYAGQAVYANRWINLNGHNATAIANPWKKYLGRYLVRSNECDYSTPNKNLTEFHVLEEDGRVYFKEISSTGYGYNGLELGNYNVNVFLNDYGEIAKGEVYATYEIGGDWSSGANNWSLVNSLRLKKTSDREFEVSRSYYYFSNDISEPDQVKTCVYKGVIQ